MMDASKKEGLKSLIPLKTIPSALHIMLLISMSVQPWCTERMEQIKARVWLQLSWHSVQNTAANQL